MPTKTIEKRVEDLEIAMTSLSVLPARVTSLETQIVHLQDEMHAGFSAMRGELEDVRGELGGLRDELRGELGGLRDELRGELGGLRDELRGELSDVRGELGGLRGELHGLRDELHGLRDEFRTGPERMATWSETRAMYEDLIERIKLLGEGIRAAVTGASSAGPVPALATTPATVVSRAGRRVPRKRR